MQVPQRHLDTAHDLYGQPVHAPAHRPQAHRVHQPPDVVGVLPEQQGAIQVNNGGTSGATYSPA